MNIVKVQMNKLLPAVCALLIFFPFISQGQSREAGIMAGVMNYKGDLNPQLFSTRFINPAIGILYRRSYSNHWAFKAGLSYGHIDGDDAKADDAFSRNRNLMFRSSILELTGQYEFNFFPYQTANPNTKATPFLLGGLTVLHFNPKALYNNEWVSLQPIGTEGQGTAQYPSRKLYKRTTAALTIGGGFKMKVGRRFGLTIESGARRVYTDYLDDVSTTYADPYAIRKEYGRIAGMLSDRSLVMNPQGDTGRQRGDVAKRDWYAFTGVQLTYTLSKKYIDSCRPFRIKLW